MALIEDIFKGNLATGLAVGVGAAIFAPTVIETVGPALRQAVKAMIKGGMVFYRETLSEIGEMASDLVAEARAELEQNSGSEPVNTAGNGGARAGLPGEQQQPAG